MTRERRRAALVMAGIGLTLSLLCGWLLMDAVGTFLAAWRAGAAKIRVSGGDVGMLALMPVFVALAAWGMVAAIRDGAALRRAGNAIAVAAMIALVIALTGAWVFQGWAEQRLMEDGYVRCGVERAGRFSALTLCARKADPA